MKLYYVPNASSLASHIALEWVDADYEAIATSFGDDILYKLNPIGTAGILEFEDGFVLSQVPAILKYLSMTYPHARIGGQGDDRAEADIDKWSSFLASDVHHAFHLLFNPARYGIDGNETARQAALQLCFRNFNVLNEHLESQTYMLGDQKSILDAYVLPMIRWSYVQFPPERKNYANLNALHDRLIEDASVISAMQQEGIWNTITR